MFYMTIAKSNQQKSYIHRYVTIALTKYQIMRDEFRIMIDSLIDNKINNKCMESMSNNIHS